MAAPRVSLGALKEPLGLSRGLQWFFSIFAFATCGGFEGSVTVSVTCAGGDNGTEARATNVTALYGYPFRLNQAVFQPSLTHLCNHTWPQDVHLVGDFSSAARFFVGVAVGAFLYSLGALGLYLGYLHLYRCAGSRLPLLDLLFSCLGAALWLGASSAWAQGLRHVRAGRDRAPPPLPLPHRQLRPPAATPMGGAGGVCDRVGGGAWMETAGGGGGVYGDGGGACKPGPAPTPRLFQAFGFLNLLLWAGGSWFVYKETPLHRPAPPPDPAPM
ncbi:synaptophysin-like protein 1 [Agelaius phoeniceus]|uniref:synaptophysin-like protein 1 n=1 Tax=Agelaius phoeniceus TaxID=39638 RepID=UPI004054A50A